MGAVRELVGKCRRRGVFTGGWTDDSKVGVRSGRRRGLEKGRVEGE